MSHFHTQGPCTNFVDATPSQPRTLILCFDGTSDKYDKDSTNVVKLHSLFNKDHVDQQLCYYQAGIGTYTAPGFISSIGKLVAKTFDMAIAWYLYQHVLDGYQFLMRNYKVGDQICLFGFSRGAYTARALAGMLHKVGLLSKDNTEQIAFAYEHYASNRENDHLAKGFKETFCRDVPIDFVGVWDTVASTGINGSLPFAGANGTIRVFRHALALDEVCSVNISTLVAPFGAPVPTPSASNAALNSSRIIIAETSRKKEVSNVFPSLGNNVEDYSPQDGRGLQGNLMCKKSDVGGGVDENEEKSPSDISLRWMVQEIVRAGVMVIFDEKALDERGIPLPMVTSQPTTNGPQPQHPQTNNVLINRKKENGNQSSSNRNWLDRDTKGIKKVVLKTKIYAWIHDQLLKTLWNFLEYSPTTFSTLDADDKLVKRWRLHRWRGRQVPSHHYFHKSVKEGIEKGYYVPKAKFKHIMGYLD
ncbi:hypothetical protein EDB85DRAFT_2137835 [Lactarius pseudohatsudake]|nr:hypothetical protein EDB85DRAFT_2137835 [Lactarius pseudohatsudake]